MTERSVGEVVLHGPHVARLYASDEALRVALVDTSTGVELGAWPVERNTDAMGVVIRKLKRIQAKLIATYGEAPAPPVSVIDALSRRLRYVFDQAGTFPEEDFDGGFTSSYALQGAPTYDDLAALLAVGRGAEAERRVASAERRVDAALRGIDPATLPVEMTFAPPGSFAAFVTRKPPMRPLGWSAGTADPIRVPLTNFAAIEQWYRNLDVRHRVQPRDFQEPVTIAGKPPAVLTVAAVRSLPLARLLTDRQWSYWRIENAIVAGLGQAIDVARTHKTPSETMLPVFVRFPGAGAGTSEPVKLWARQEPGTYVLDAMAQYGAGPIEEGRQRGPAGVYAKVRTFGLNGRPPAYASVPSGWEYVPGQSIFRHGMIRYDRALTDDEIASYEMTPVYDSPREAAATLLDAVSRTDKRGVAAFLEDARENIAAYVEMDSEMNPPSDWVRAASSIVHDATRIHPMGQYTAAELYPYVRALVFPNTSLKPTKAPLFGTPSTNEESRYFGTRVRVKAEGRTSPSWNAVVFSVQNRGESVYVTQPRWNGRWGGDVPTVMIPVERIGDVLEWHDEKGEKGTKFDPYTDSDMPESDDADNRVEFFREYLSTDLRAAPPVSPTVIVTWDGEGRLTVAMGAANRGDLPYEIAPSDAVLDGWASLFARDANRDVMQQATRAVRASQTRHAGGFWNAATLQMMQMRDIQKYRDAAFVAAKKMASIIEESGRADRKYRFFVAGPPYDNGRATIVGIVGPYDHIAKAAKRNGRRVR